MKLTRPTLSRRAFLNRLLGGTSAAAASVMLPSSIGALSAPARATAEALRPAMPAGISSGDIAADGWG